jgi:hypothetical protein
VNETRAVARGLNKTELESIEFLQAFTFLISGKVSSYFQATLRSKGKIVITYIIVTDFD